ncbi:hypothetical protein SmJEL517_g02679 [Synchytrium microbalum]|uniref:Methyltransferase domain-containing protein n=1 Tax=Synchytrium microbalum TaxID=1806994 RepID=A0A507CAZ9_9FUNG|nr:uncharacterized protein SmJEL517_g02679 [Synchytrium microbalum]TPX34703.1 hypothetical protein SmJEL517_g02679 [Synchytrium microbalum]
MEDLKNGHRQSSPLTGIKVTFAIVVIATALAWAYLTYSETSMFCPQQGQTLLVSDSAAPQSALTCPPCQYKEEKVAPSSNTDWFTHVGEEDDAEAMLRGISYITRRTISSPKQHLLGGNPLLGGDVGRLDGAWPVALTVYSFGINYDFSFDDAVADAYGCQVFSFDRKLPLPVLGQATMTNDTHRRSDKVMFYKIGLSDTSGVNDQGWNTTTVKETMATLGHDRIDVFKMDIEGLGKSHISLVKHRLLTLLLPNNETLTGGEWPVLKQWLVEQPEVLAKIDQLSLEIHFDWRKASDQADMLRDLQAKAGLRIWNWHTNPLVGSLNLGNIKPMQLAFLYEVSFMRPAN